MEKVDAWNVFWTILTALISYVAVMATMIMRRLNQMDKRIDQKVGLTACKEHRDDCQDDCEKSRADRARFIHIHGSLGTAGEVIK